MTGQENKSGMNGGMGKNGALSVRFDPSSDTSCPVYPVLALAHASPSVFVIRLMYIDVQPLAP